jgi:hypothetical protein
VVKLKNWIVSQERGYPMLCQLVAWLDAARSAEQANFLRNRIGGYLDALRDLGVISNRQFQAFRREVDDV